MDWHALAQFLAATFLLLATPGPIMAIVAHNTLRHGTAAGLMTVVGVELGDVCLLGAAFTGLTLSGELLPGVLRWLSLAGALYLVWLAAQALLVRRGAPRTPDVSACRKPALSGLAIVFANPARPLFYTAFFPQFIDPDRSISQQLIVLSALFLCTALAFEFSCVLAVARLRLPAGWRTRIGRFAGPGSAVVYFSIAVVAVLRFIETSG